MKMKRKRKKKESTVCRDRLSELPESLLAEILSLLPFEEAVRTGVLSTKWKSLWNYVDKIVINCYTEPSTPHPEKKHRNFISFVDHALMHSVCPKTVYLCNPTLVQWVRPNTRCLTKSPKDQFLYDLLDKCLQRVYSLKLESLTVDIQGLGYAPPEWFYHNSTLVKLDISYWDFTIPGPVVSWTLLKSLSLHRVTIGGEQIAKILSGCPLLEDLDLEILRGSLKSLNIMSLRLVKLSISYFCCLVADKLESLWEINAPWLQFLNLNGYFHRSVVRLINISSLVHANLNFTNEEDLLPDAASKVLEKLHCPQELTVGHIFVLALSMFKLAGRPCPLFKCKRVTFIMPIFKFELPGIVFILQNSHHLETLVIEVRTYLQCDNHENLEERCDFDASVYLSTEIGGFPHLKSIEVAYCKSFDDDDYCIETAYFGEKKLFVFELVASIMRKAPVLEELVIAPREECCKCSRNSEEASVLSHKLWPLFVDRE